MKKAIDWGLFDPLLKDLYHNDTDRGGIPNIPVITMVKVLYLESIFNLVNDQAEKEIHDRISFMNFFLIIQISILMQEPYGYFVRDYRRLEETGLYGINCRNSLK